MFLFCPEERDTRFLRNLGQDLLEYRSHCPKDYDMNFHSCINLKSHICNPCGETKQSQLRAFASYLICVNTQLGPFDYERV
jgi:hypothetical protein